MIGIPVLQSKFTHALAVTVTLNQNYHKESLMDQYAMTRNELLRIFKPIGQFTFCPELTQAGVLHWHGYLFVEDTIKYFKTIHLAKQIGFVCIKTIKDDDDFTRWYSYMIKDTQKILEVDEELREICECDKIELQRYVKQNNNKFKTIFEYLKEQ